MLKQGAQHHRAVEIPYPASAAHSTAVRYDGAMRRPKPSFGTQRSASGAFSLSRSLPKLSLPASAVPKTTRAKPVIGKPSPGGRVKGGRNE